MHERVAAYRKRMRAKGLRLVQMWLPDTRTPEFAKQAHRASLAIANSPAGQQNTTTFTWNNLQTDPSYGTQWVITFTRD